MVPPAAGRDLPADPTALIVVIGNEILAGEVTDTNSPWLARQLHGLGVDVRQIVTIADAVEEIVSSLVWARPRFDLIFVTGGIGPTPDDLTREAVARAVGRPLEMHLEALSLLRAGYGDRLEETTRAMALLPQGSELIVGPRTRTHGFFVENIYVFPGIPDLLQEMFPEIAPALKASPIFTESFVTRLPESAFARVMAAAMDLFPRVAIGSYPFSAGGVYEVKLSFRSRDPALAAQARDWLRDEVTRIATHRNQGVG